MYCLYVTQRHVTRLLRKAHKNGTLKGAIFTGSPSSIYEQLLKCWLTLALLRDSSDLHIYKDLYGKITIVSVTYENVAI